MNCYKHYTPAETSTTAMKSDISSDSNPSMLSFSLKSNMASSRVPMPSALKDARGYICPFKNVTVRCLASKSKQNRTIKTCETYGLAKNDKINVLNIQTIMWIMGHMEVVNSLWSRYDPAIRLLWGCYKVMMLF